MLPTRHAARLVVLSPEDRMLLFDTEVLTAEDPLRPGTTRYWNAPGGGVEPGETFEQAAIRELHEETGICDVTLGPWVWMSERVLSFSDGRSMRFHERYFMVRSRSELADISKLFGEEVDWIKVYRWWSAAEIEASDDVFIPSYLARLVTDLAAGRFPESPICIDDPLGS